MLNPDHPWPLEDRLQHLEIVANEKQARYLERVWIVNDAEGFTGWRWEKYNVQLRVVAAANRYGNFVVVGARHHCVTMNGIIDLIGIDALHAYAGGDENEEQGFIDQYGTFHDRQEAAIIAIEAGQVDEENLRGTHLFSEDVW